MKKYKIMSVFGTRPEAIKMAPLVKELSKYDDLESICCLTGQHREMLDSVMEIFKLQADFDLNIMEKRQTLSTITTKTLLGMERVMEQCKPRYDSGAWRYLYHLCRRTGGLLPPGARGACGGRSQNLR